MCRRFAATHFSRTREFPRKASGSAEFSYGGSRRGVWYASCLPRAVSRVESRVRCAEEFAALLSEIPRAEPVEIAAPTGGRSITVPVFLTCAALLVAAVLLADPRATEDPAVAERRIEQDAGVLAGLIERYHVEARRYPDAAAWRISVAQGDPRFFDPWRRPYHYRLDADSFSIGSYGADGEPGGTGIDRDVERSFPIRTSKDPTRD
jgi:general secretion pathway protein G